MSEHLHHIKDHTYETRIFGNRLVVATTIVVAMLLLLIIRFYTLQVLDYRDYATRSDRNRIQVQPVPPNRGLIFDRRGHLLAENRPSFTVSLVPERIHDLQAVLDELKQLLTLTDEHIANFHKARKQRRRPYEPIPLRFRLTEAEIAKIAVNEYHLQGVEIEAQLVRYYPYGELFSHTLGYVGQINEEELTGFDETTFRLYQGTRSIGKIGLEKFYEQDLLGVVGYRSVETNALGRVLQVLQQTDPSPGQDLTLFLDVDLQKAARDMLGERRGAVVAIEVATGGVLAMVSTPSFDPNLFVTGISHKDYRALNTSKDLPLFDRTIQGQYPAGSTLKPMLGLGGLELGLTHFNRRINDPGFYQLPNDERFYRDWKKGGHGKHVDLHQAIVESCDTYFYDLAYKMGIDHMHEFGTYFGLGSRTGIDIPSEVQGLWPSRAWKRAARGLHWFPGDSLNVSIGQGDVLTTPLQLAVMTATLASRGERLTPRLVVQVNDQPTYRQRVHQYEGKKANWDYVLGAMEDVVHGLQGTANIINRGAKQRMAGKTGTAQVVGIAQGEEYDRDKLHERNRDHALFIGYAPAEAPQIAVAVIVENGEHGSKAAAPIARKLFDTYMAINRETIAVSPVEQEG